MHYHKNMQKSERIKKIVAAIVNLIIVGLMTYCLITLIRSYNVGNNRFIYFTYVSNLTVGLMSLVNAAFLILSVIKNKNCIPNIFSLIKMVAISMTTLTFFTVLFVIGPVDGYANNYSGRQLIAHLIVPLLSPLSYFFLEEKLQLKWKYSLFVLVPFGIYAVVYIINVVILKSWPDIYWINKQGLWYLFLLAFAVADFGIGQGLYFLKKFIDKKAAL